MDDSTAAETRNGKRARLAAASPPPPGDDVAVDRISGLGDDVLLHVLALVSDARDVVRTGALSRRWLGLWKRVPALSFVSRSMWEITDVEERAALQRFVYSVNGVLAQRTQSGCAAMERLAISYTTHSPINEQDRPYLNDVPESDIFLNGTGGISHPAGERYLERLLMPASVDALQGWIRFAFQHEMKSFSLDMRLPYFWTYFMFGRDTERIITGAKSGHGNEYKPVVFLDVLPAASPVKLEGLHLVLGGAILRLPAVMEFTSLTDLSLEWIRMEAGSGSVHLLARLLSSATCPRLRKLRLRKLCLDALDQEMLIEADMLSELRIHDIKFLSLKLRTPSLKVFHLHQPWHQPLTISAPRLEELEVSFPQGTPLRWLNVDGDLPCVRSLKIFIKSHRPRTRSNGEAEAAIDTNVQLLKHCGSLTCLDVTLTGGEPLNEWDVDIIKSRVPHLPHITSLSVNISPWLGRHGYGASLANLLTRFHNLICLSLHLPFFKSMDHETTTGLDHLCHHQYRWKYKFPMTHLREVELTGLIGTDCEFWFMKTILSGARTLRKVAISFNPNCWQLEDKMDAFECILFNEGMHTSHRDAFILTCVKCGLI